MKIVPLSHSLQVILISCGVLLVALVLKVSVPLVVDFSVCQAPLIWSSLSSWLRPPYVYVIFNCIIITIVASSRFLHNSHGFDHHHGDNQHEQVPVSSKIVLDSMPHPDQFDYEVKASRAEIQFGGMESMVEEKGISFMSDVFEDKSSVLVNSSVEESAVDRDEDEFVISRSAWIPPKRIGSSENPPDILTSAERPLISARFSHRKPLKASPEGGRALRVSKPKRQETLENTWKTITEGRAIPLTRHLKKSDAWENHGCHVNNNVSVAETSPMPKSETFKDRTNYQSPVLAPASGRLRKEPSLSQDELNRRVEAFIKKFNEEMRLQRQESLNQYKEMVSRGAY